MAGAILNTESSEPSKDSPESEDAPSESQQSQDANWETKDDGDASNGPGEQLQQEIPATMDVKQNDDEPSQSAGEEDEHKGYAFHDSGVQQR